MRFPDVIMLKTEPFRMLVKLKELCINCEFCCIQDAPNSCARRLVAYLNRSCVIELLVGHQVEQGWRTSSLAHFCVYINIWSNLISQQFCKLELSFVTTLLLLVGVFTLNSEKFRYSKKQKTVCVVDYFESSNMQSHCRSNFTTEGCTARFEAFMV